MTWVYAALLGYLLGSVPFGLILTNLFGAGNLREIGSGNIGATNVLRTGNKGLAAATLLLDGAKGAAAVVIAAAVFRADAAFAAPLAGLAALIGHCFPVWLKFKGGKGIATLLGVSLALHWSIGLVALLVWIVAALFTRISSLGGLCAALSAPIMAIILLQFSGVASGGSTYMVASFCALSAMVTVIFWQHRENIARLRAGTEPRIGQKSA